MTEIETRVAAIADLYDRAIRLARRMATACPTLAVPIVTATGITAVEETIKTRPELAKSVAKVMGAGLDLPQSGRAERMLSALVVFLTGAPDAWGAVEPWFARATVNAVAAATEGRATPAEVAGRIALAILVTASKAGSAKENP